jgi:hypothetical protein
MRCSPMTVTSCWAPLGLAAKTVNPFKSAGTINLAALCAVAVSRPDAAPSLATTLGVKNCNMRYEV